MTDLLLPTKLFPPQIRSGFITRPRLIKTLNDGLEGRFTLVSAPAGFGKTTLLAEWISHQRGTGDRSQHFLLSKLGWLSLDDHENDLNQFLIYLLAAFQQADETLGQNVLPRLISAEPVPAESILAILINDLAALEGKLGLFLDDYHLISNPAVHTAVAFLIEHAPPQLHLAICGRSDPPLSLSRWRVRGELNEIRAIDLRFTTEETTRFLQQALSPAQAEVATELLVQRTEGWPAGLQLAALSLRGLDTTATAEFITGFGGTNRHIFHYLIEEVLQRQPPFVQQFLLQTTMLNRLSAPLCDAVTLINAGEAAQERQFSTPNSGYHSQPILDYLAKNNLFLMPLDETGQWFRYHTLFAETLQARLKESHPNLIPELHRRAGHWYADNGFIHQAIQHTLASNDADIATELIESAVDRLWPQGHLGLLLNWLNALPEETFHNHLKLCLSHAWLLFLHDRWAEAEDRLHLAELQLAGLPADDPLSLHQSGRWAAIKGALAAHRQDAAEAIMWMESALKNLPADDLHWRQVAMIGLGLAQMAEGQAQAAMNAFQQAAQDCEYCQDTYLAFAALWHQSEACWAQGRLHGVEECMHRLELLADQDEGNWLALPANAAIGRGMLAYERNDLDQAGELLKGALSQVWPGGQPRIVLDAYLTLAWLAGITGDESERDRYLELVAQLEHRFNLAAEKIQITAATVRLHLAQGQVMDAFWHLENAGIGPESPADFHHEPGLLALARLYLAERQPEAALALLSRVLPPAEQARRNGSLLEIFLLRALALAQLHRHDSAVECLNKALKLAEPERYARVFINEGRPVAQLLLQINPRTPYITRLLGQMDGPPVTEPLLEPLTARETEILQLVADGATNQAIAKELFISVGTVKGHLYHILGKLDAQNRTEAVARGRQIGLL